MPTVVGETSTGDTIFGVRGVRLVLRPGATHFNRVVSCSKCKCDVPGASVLSPADLDLTPNPVICKRCVRTAGTGLFAARDRHSLAPPAPTPPAPAVSEPETKQQPAPSAAEDRLAALEQGLADLATLITSAPTAGAAADESAAKNGEARLEALERSFSEAVEQLRARGESQVSELLATLDGTRLAEQSQSVSAQVQDLEERIQHFRATVDARTDPAQSLEAALKQAKVELERVETRLDERLERLAAGVVSQRTELQAVLKEEMRQRLDQLEQEVAQAAEAGGDAARIASEEKARRREQKALLRRFDKVAELVQQLQASVEADRGRAQSDSAALAQANIELARVEEQINERFDRLAEKVARADDTEAERQRSLEEQVKEGLGRITAALESHRRELQTGLREGLAEVQAAVPTPALVSDSRLEALEERLEKSDYEVSELGELHGALDVGLGALRSELGEVRSAVKKVNEQQADMQDRRGGFNRAPQAAPPADPARGWKPGRKAEAGANRAVAIEAAENLAREHQQLKAQVAQLEKAAEAATAAAARASSQASTSGPLRSDVRLLQEQLAEQNEALAALSRAVERLRRKVSPPAVAEPVAKPVRKRAAKAATATKATKAARPAGKTARKATKAR